MNSYLEISLLPDPEFSPMTLMNVLFSKLHRGLVSLGEQNIGVSFPDSGEKCTPLGSRLRLHGTAANLKKLMDLDWIFGIRDHINVGEITPMPAHAKHRIVRRVQAKSNPERDRRRLMSRKDISVEEAKLTIPDSAAERLRLPYLFLSSQSTRQQFRLFIEHLPVQEKAIVGTYSTYGLSPSATVPWF